MNSQEIKRIKQKMVACVDAGFFDKNKPRCPSIKQMATYLKETHPELEVNIRALSTYKTTKPSGFRYTTGGGTKEYKGTLLVVKKGDEIIIDHDTTETYRENREVAEKILKL